MLNFVTRNKCPSSVLSAPQHNRLVATGRAYCRLIYISDIPDGSLVRIESEEKERACNVSLQRSGEERTISDK